MLDAAPTETPLNSQIFLTTAKQAEKIFDEVIVRL